jgi:hypothetical protein
MEKIKIGRATENDVAGILLLQEKNLLCNLSEEERQTGGFIILKSDPTDLKKFINENDVAIAKIGDKIIGYLISLSQKNCDQISFLKLLTDKASKLSYNNKPLNEYSWCVFAQIAIDKDFRGLGINELLHLEIKKELEGKYDLAVTDIAESNQRSLHVHLNKRGYKEISRYETDGFWWIVVVLDLK